MRQWCGKTALKTARGCIAASPDVKSDAFEELPLLLGFLFCWHSILLSSFELSANNDWRSALSFQCIVTVESIVKQKVIAMNENFAQRVRFVATITPHSSRSDQARASFGPSSLLQSSCAARTSVVGASSIAVKRAPLNRHHRKRLSLSFDRGFSS